MVRAPSIRGRPAPERKVKSSSFGGPLSVTTSASTTSSASPTSNSRTSTAMNKSLKRAQKRAQLLQKTRIAPDARDPSLNHHAVSAAFVRLSDGGQGGEAHLSKSAVRRRKRHARDDLAKDEKQGRQGGVTDLKEVMEDLEEEMDEEEDDAAAAAAAQYADGQAEGSVGSTKGGRVTTNHRKRVLEEEQRRMKAILATPEYSASPFAALREHARNSMGHHTAPRQC